MWLLKPSYGSKGLGVRLVNDSLLRILQERESLRVVQKYVERPLLIRGHKFDLRCWLLVSRWLPLRLWFYDECILRICAASFSLDELANPLRHITNRSINSKRVSSAGSSRSSHSSLPSSFNPSLPSRRPFSAGARGGVASLRSAEELGVAVAAEQSSSAVSAGLWSGGQLDEYLQRMGKGDVWQRSVLPEMRKLARATMLSGVERVEARKESFELYGIDMILDETLKPWLIEARCFAVLRWLPLALPPVSVPSSPLLPLHPSRQPALQ